AAYHNLRAHVVPDGNGNIPAGATVLLRAGDLLMDDMGNRFWVEFVDPANGSAVVKDESDALVTTFNHALTVIRSGNRNQQDASAYSLVSLEDPLNARQFPLFALWNGLVAAATNPFSSVHQIIHCHNQQTEQVEFIDPTAPHLDHELWINPGDAQGPCHARIEFAVALPVDMHLYTLKKAGDKVYAFGPNGEQLIGDWVDTDYCYKECLDGVLNTQLVRLKDTWDYDYTDALVPFPITGAQGTVTATSMTDNPYRYGRSGIYRPEKNYLFYTQRVQQGNADPITVAPGTNTNVRKDGVFDKFFFYNWNTAEQNNYPWNARNEITQYSPYGWELE
ncbi:MAG: hypothetical protein AAGB22_16185, partial [Bacteroidota bacterium]